MNWIVRALRVVRGELYAFADYSRHNPVQVILGCTYFLHYFNMACYFGLGNVDALLWALRFGPIIYFFFYCLVKFLLLGREGLRGYLRSVFEMLKGRRDAMYSSWYLPVTGTTTSATLNEHAVDISSLGLSEDDWFGVLDYLDGPTLFKVQLVSKSFRREAMSVVRGSERAKEYQYCVASKFAEYVDTISTMRAIHEGIPVYVLGGADEEECVYRFFVRISFKALAMQGWYGYKLRGNGQGILLEAGDCDDKDEEGKHVREVLETALKAPFASLAQRKLQLSLLMEDFNVTIVAIDQKTLIPSVVFKIDEWVLAGNIWDTHRPSAEVREQNAVFRAKRSGRTDGCDLSYFGSMNLQSDDNDSLRFRIAAVWGCFDRWARGPDPPLTRHAAFRVTPSASWSLYVYNENG